MEEKSVDGLDLGQGKGKGIWFADAGASGRHRAAQPLHCTALPLSFFLFWCTYGYCTTVRLGTVPGGGGGGGDDGEGEGAQRGGAEGHHPPTSPPPGRASRLLSGCGFLRVRST